MKTTTTFPLIPETSFSPCTFKARASSAFGKVSRLKAVQWIHIIDNGGQPQFHEVFPEFIDIIFVMKLSEGWRSSGQHYNESEDWYRKSYHHALSSEQILVLCWNHPVAIIYRGRETFKNFCSRHTQSWIFLVRIFWSKKLKVSLHQHYKIIWLVLCWNCPVAIINRGRETFKNFCSRHTILVTILWSKKSKVSLHQHYNINWLSTVQFSDLSFPMNAKTTMEQGDQVWAMIHRHIEDKKKSSLTPPFHWMVSAKVGVISKRECLGIAAVLNIDAEAHTAPLE